MNEVKKLLSQVASGEITPEEAEIRLKMKPFEDLGFAKPDIHRALRQGATEVIFGEGKTPEQISAISSELLGSGQETVIITRLSEEKSKEITTPLTYFKDARIGVCGRINPPDTDGKILIATEGCGIDAEKARAIRGAVEEVKRACEIVQGQLQMVASSSPKKPLVLRQNPK